MLQKQNVYGEGEVYRLFCKNLSTDDCEWVSAFEENKDAFKMLIKDRLRV